MEILSLLADLDDAARANLLAFVDRDLQKEYLPKHRAKAAKLTPEALYEGRLSGERIAVQLRELGKSYRIDMTFPLFDLATDYTLVVCSCQRDSLSLEAPRCHHMYFVQDRFRTALQALAAAAPDDPIAGLESLAAGEQLEEDDLWLTEFRWRRIFDPLRWTLHFERQAKDRYESDAPWRWHKTFTLEEWVSFARLKPLADANQQIFDVISEAREEAMPLSDGHRIISIENAPLTFDISETPMGLVVKPAFSERHLWVKGRGVLGWSEETATLLITPFGDREAGFIEYLLRMKKPFPAVHRERVLELLGRLDAGLFHLGQDADGPLEPASYGAVLRLTPFKRGGMRVELRLRVEAGLALVPGEGEGTLNRLGAPGRWIRDLARERRLEEELVERLGLSSLPMPEPGMWIAFNDARALEFVARLEAEKGRADFVVEWPSFLARKQYEMADALKVQNLKVTVGEKKDWLAVEGWLELDDGRKLSLREILKAIKRRNNYLQLPDGRWSLIPDHFKERIGGLVDSIEIAEDDSMSLDLAALDDPSTLAAVESFPFQESSKKFWSTVARARRSQNLAIPLPKGLRAELRPYQQEGFRWLARLADWGLGACLADDMGLGKTLQTLAVLLSRKDEGPSLVIAPSSLGYNWQSEAAKFAPLLNIVQMRELSGRGLGATFTNGDVVIASYGLVLRYAEHLAATPWNVLVLDEAQTIKNAQTKTAQAVQTLDAKWKVALSGTPIENHLGDLWSLFRTLSPGLFGDWEGFKRSFVYPIEREDSAGAKLRLKNKIAPFVLRRMKKDYLTELPEKTEIDLWIDLSAEEQAVYDALRGEAIDKVQVLLDEDPEAKTQMQILAALTRLRQAACHTALVDESWQGSSSKAEALRDRLLELRDSGHAALAFSQFTRFLKLIQSELKALGLRVLYLDGQTPAQERLRLVELFQKGDYDVFLISLKAGGTGLNLTRASYVFHLDPWWNPAIENQASDRAYRMGQKQAVTVYRLRSRGTIEEMIHAMHGEKRALVESVLEGRQEGDGIQWKNLWRALWPEGASKKKPPTHVGDLF